MARLLVLVATDPSLVGAAMAAALQQVRPDVDIIVADPAAVADDLARYHPDVAIISERHGMVEARVPSWVRLPADGSNTAVMSVVGRVQTIEHVRMTDLVSLVDQTPCVAA